MLLTGSIVSIVNVIDPKSFSRISHPASAFRGVSGSSPPFSPIMRSELLQVTIRLAIFSSSSSKSMLIMGVHSSFSVVSIGVTQIFPSKSSQNSVVILKLSPVPAMRFLSISLLD